MEKLVLPPSHGCVDAANIGYQNGICNANQAATATKTAKTTTTIGLISKKKTTLHVQHTFFVHLFAIVLQDDIRKFGKLCIQEILVLRKSSVRGTSVRTSTPSCKPG